MRYRKGILFAVILCIGLGSMISLRLAISQSQAPKPQAILVLEGRTQRIHFAAQIAQTYENLPIWVSGNPAGLQTNQLIFQQAGIDAQRVHYDFCAIDTVTNFTCNVRDFRNHKIQHIYVVTSDYHMTRALAISFVVLGSRGIIATPISVISTDNRVESPWKTLRDSLRSLVWLVTGHTGASLKRFL
ncbi:MAG: YdcF family protein [Leptolyngbya sp. SIO1D8]|nr:YdcF family protein [Leptolyngbya sp. SIO1D8]